MRFLKSNEIDESYFFCFIGYIKTRTEEAFRKFTVEKKYITKRNVKRLRKSIKTDFWRADVRFQLLEFFHGN